MLDLETFLEDLQYNDHILVERDFTRRGAKEDYTWKVSAQPTSNVELVFIWGRQRFGVSVIGRNYTVEESEKLLEQIEKILGIAAQLNEYIDA